jgi:murein DD-endopeptidase MepM/ murein hydrolase activator NlpD
MESVPIRILPLVVLAAVALGGGAALATPAPGPQASARALAVRIVLPGGRVVGSPAAAGDGTSAAGQSYSYPDDGSVIVTAGFEASAKTGVEKSATARSSGTASNVSIFEGEITADTISGRASAATGNGNAGGAFQGTGVSHLQALGRAHAFGRANLGDWGYLVIGGHTIDRTAPEGLKGFDGVAVGLDIHLTRPHAGLPAGTEIEVGYAQAGAITAPPPGANTELGPMPGDRPQLLPPQTGPLVGVPQITAPLLDAGPYDYPVYGRTRVADQYGTAGKGLSWEHGVDIFGQLGQPLVAVADGTLFSVGWNHSAGNRLSLRDRQGNEFYYAHLSAFSTLTSNGAHVRAGQVLGFMGNTGNTSGRPTHVRFEVHPVSMLFLGNDGAVDPGAYLPSWHRIVSLAFPVATGWAPKVPGTIKAPQPGASLIGSTDISTASGLDPAALRRAVRPGVPG